jgi:hypothetical protein
VARAKKAGSALTDAEGLTMLTGISGAYTGGLFFQSVNPYFNPSFTIFNGEVLFSGTDASGNLGLWVTNGTAVGTHELIGGAFGLRSEFCHHSNPVFRGGSAPKFHPPRMIE